MNAQRNLPEILRLHAEWLAADQPDDDLSRADLSRAYLSGAKGVPAAPIVPNIDAAIVAAIEHGGALKMASWHTCGTTHCRAGWAITLAGEEGAELERRCGASVAGALIYAASRPGERVPDWYASDDDALTDLRRCALVSP